MVRAWVVLVFGVLAVHLLDDLDIHRITFRSPSAIVGLHHLDVSESIAGRGVNPTYHLVVFVIVFGHLYSHSRLSSLSSMGFLQSARKSARPPACAKSR